ncbi:MAG: hypothetical protein ACFCUG_04600 [Thiotrichales bacterium]
MTDFHLPQSTIDMLHALGVQPERALEVPAPPGAPLRRGSELQALVEDLLRLAERRIGPRDHNFALVQVDFESSDNPRIVLPYGRNEALIHLTRGAAHDGRRLIFQLSHEVFHLVSPTRLAVNILEEGLATEFSLVCCRLHGYAVADAYINLVDYRLALAGVRCLRQFEPELDARCAEIRAAGVKLGCAAADYLASVWTEAPAPLVAALAMPFSTIRTYRNDLRRYVGECRPGE